MKKHLIKYESSEGNRMFGDFYPADNSDSVVLYFHGFKGFKDWGFVPFIAKNLTKKGINFLAFNFSHNGIGEDFLEFTEEEKFRKNTFSLEFTEGAELISALLNGTLIPQKGPMKVGLLGHSRGGGIAFLTGRNFPELKGIVSWAAVSTFFRYPDSKIQEWKKKGQIEVVNSRTGQVLYLDYNLHQDLLDYGDDKLNIVRACQETTVPSLIVHSIDDPVVSTNDANKIYDSLKSEIKELYFLQRGGHTMGAKHPLLEIPETLELAVDKTVEFFSKHFKENTL